jgi:hypothetical protein
MRRTPSGGVEPISIDSRGTAASTLIRAIRKITPKLIDKLNGGENITLLLSQLTGIRKPRILIVGGRHAGVEMREALANPRYEFVEMDGYCGESANVIRPYWSTWCLRAVASRRCIASCVPGA